MKDIPITIRAIYISPNHDFKGHFGKPRGHHPMENRERVYCVAGRGLKGDRYFGFHDDYKGQITFFDWDVYNRIREEFKKPGLEPSAFRRNVVLKSIDLNGLVGVRFEIQGIRFEGTEECRPCIWMDEAVAPGAKVFLKGRGGLRARIQSDGYLSAGESRLTILEKAPPP